MVVNLLNKKCREGGGNTLSFVTKTQKLDKIFFDDEMHKKSFLGLKGRGISSRNVQNL